MTGDFRTDPLRGTVRAAVVQAAPVLFDRDATVAKLHALTQEAAAQGAQVVVFPEAFVPAYPRGFSFGMVVGSRTDEGRRLWERYWRNAVDVPGPAVDEIGRAARQAGVHLAVGVIERDRVATGGTLYCTILYFGPDGALLGKHRKLKPTGSERLIWGQGDGSTLTVLETPLGRLGGLICWENAQRPDGHAPGASNSTSRPRPLPRQLAGHHAPHRTGRALLCARLQPVRHQEHAPGRPPLPGRTRVPARNHVPGRQRHRRAAGRRARRPLYDAEGILTADLDLGEIITRPAGF
ncbi:MAG: nitrilase-related carbon-nitrogen hydrolase [Caldilineaceae bacterium]